MIVWIVPQQLFDYAMATPGASLPVPSRGVAWCSRLKRIARKCPCWRPLAATKIAYNFFRSDTKERGHSGQAYGSSPMMQLMERIAFQESTWTDTQSVFARPDRIRLRQQLRSSKMKCEIADEVSVGEAVTMVSALSAACRAASPST